MEVLNLIKSESNNLDTKSLLKYILLYIDTPLVPHKNQFKKNMKILSKNISIFLTILSEKTDKYPNKFYLWENGELDLVFGETESENAHAIELIFDIEKGDKEYFYGVSLQIGNDIGRWQRDEIKYPFLKSPLKYNYISDELIKYINNEIKY